MRYNVLNLVAIYNITTIRTIFNTKMGQMLSREDDDDHQYDDEQFEPKHAEDQDAKEKPKRRQRNQAAVRSRKPRTATQGRTRRNRANNSITFEVREH